MSLKKHKIVKVKPGPIIFKGRSYDLSKINDQTAAYLHEQGCRLVQPLPPPKTSKEKD